MYNLVRRQAEVEIFPLAAAEHLGVITYSPLGGGLLTGKYGTGMAPRAAAGRKRPLRDRYGLDSDYETAAASRRSLMRSASSPQPSPWRGRCLTRR